MAYKLKLLKQGFQNIAPYILSEIYTSECRIMQLRIIVKTKFSGEHAPGPPPPQPNFAPTAQICSLYCIGQILGLDPALANAYT